SYTLNHVLLKNLFAYRHSFSSVTSSYLLFDRVHSWFEEFCSTLSISLATVNRLAVHFFMIRFRILFINALTLVTQLVVVFVVFFLNVRVTLEVAILKFLRLNSDD